MKLTVTLTVCSIPSIDSLSIIAYPLQGRRGLELIPADIGRELEYVLDKSQGLIHESEN